MTGGQQIVHDDKSVNLVILSKGASTCCVLTKLRSNCSWLRLLSRSKLTASKSIKTNLTVRQLDAGPPGCALLRISGGAEILVHTVHAMTQLNRNKVVLKVDISNAYNAISRQSWKRWSDTSRKSCPIPTLRSMRTPKSSSPQRTRQSHCWSR
jgi:hypothetical protein